MPDELDLVRQLFAADPPVLDDGARVRIQTWIAAGAHLDGELGLTTLAGAVGESPAARVAGSDDLGTDLHVEDIAASWSAPGPEAAEGRHPTGDRPGRGLREGRARPTGWARGWGGAAVGVVVAAAAIAALLLIPTGPATRPQQVQVTGGSAAPSAAPGRRSAERTGPIVGAPPVTLPSVAHPAGSAPVDFGQARLWLPRGWVVETGGQPGVCPSPNVVILGSATTADCPAEPFDPDASYLFVHTLTGAIPPDYLHLVIHGVAARDSEDESSPAPGRIVYDLPTLGVQLLAVGPSALRVTRTLQPSSLHAVLAQRFPASVPRSWRVGRRDGFSYRYPRGWALAQSPVGATRSLCGRVDLTALPVSATPPPCPSASPFAANAAPASGIELRAISPAQAQQILRRPGVATRTLPTSPVNETLVYFPGSSNGSVVAIVRRADAADAAGAAETGGAGGPAGRIELAVVGLGTDPATAEEILSSFAAVG